MKKFLSVALLMIIGTTIFLIGSKSFINLRDKALGNGQYVDVLTRLEASFIKWEDDGSKYNFYINVKNNHNKIISLDNMRMVFAKDNPNENINDEWGKSSDFHGRCIELPIIGQIYQGYDEPMKAFGIDPGDSRVVIFSLPKEVSFDKAVNFNKMKLNLEVTEYSYRIKSTLYGSRTSWGMPIYFKNTGEPIVIDNN